MTRLPTGPGTAGAASSRRGARRWLGAIGLAFAVLAFIPAGTLGHAEVVLAKPAPGLGLAQAPAAVVIKFTEPLNPTLSRIEVLDASGADVGTGATEPIEGDETAMQRRLGLLPPGQYTVRWTTVSTLDGHVLRGTYRFGVGTATSGDETIASSPLDSEGPLGLLGRFLLMGGLALWSGLALLLGVARRAGVAERRLRQISHVAPLLVVIGGSAALVSSALVAAGSLDGLPGVVQGSSGELRLALVAAAGIGALVGVRWRLVAVGLASIALVAEAASGHAASSPLPLFATATFALHLGAVGVWVFTMVASLSTGGGVRDALARFARYAIGAAVVVGLTGLASGVLVLSHVGDLVATDYGLIVLAKVFAFVFMAGLGITHHLRRRHPAATPGSLRLPLRTEASTALVAIALATLLVGFPNAPRESEAAERFTGADAFLEELPSVEAVSVAEADGGIIVGLSVSPPRPGPVDVHVNVLGLDPADAPRDVRFVASGPGGQAQAPLSPCGLGCFEGRSSISQAGPWSLGVRFESNRGPVATSTEVDIPAADGSRLYGDVLVAMEGLRSVEMLEMLRGSTDGPLVEVSYVFRAPDLMAIRAGDTERVVSGVDDFRRSGGGSWERLAWPGSPFTWPGSYYRDFWSRAAAIRVIGEEELDGVRTSVLSFVRTDLPAWFLLWVGPGDRVHRLVMLAEGHLMEQRYAEFDQAEEVPVPAAAVP